MNIPVFIAGVLSLMATIGHFTMGRKMYLKPLLNSQVEPLIKAVFRGVFHYSSALLLMSTFFLLVIGVRGSYCMFEPFLVLLFNVSST